jgi:4-hydroxybenzoate polyprenyltransferase
VAAARSILSLFRPRQWYKNLILLAPLLFSNNLATTAFWKPAGLAFAAFCLLSSATYCLNDALDAPRDRLHPTKRNRPVASGLVPVPLAFLLALLLAVGGLAVLFTINRAALAFGAAYLGLQLLYNLFLKRVFLWDLLAIAIGFVLRALAGTYVLAGVPPTTWLIVCTFLFAFHLGLAKRRHELLVSGREHRAVLAHYSVAFVEQTMQVSTALLLAAYTLYTFFGPHLAMMATIPFAFYGVLRYNHLVHRPDLGDEPDLIFRDPATMVNAAAWILAVALVQAGVVGRLLTGLQGT